MQPQPYDYSHRKGIEVVTWERFMALSAVLAERLAAEGVQAIVGTARSGLFPATAVACSLRKMLYPAAVSRRVDDQVLHASPVWHVDVSAEVAGKVVAVVDEIADSGETLALLARRALE